MEYRDQMNRVLFLEKMPERIVSLVPSQTELLIDLGLMDRLVGVTKFCVHPKGIRDRKTIIGGTKHFNFERIHLLQPDLIIGNKEENYQEGIEQLSGRYPVWMSDIYNLEDAFRMMQSIGAITGSQEKSSKMVKAISTEFQKQFEFKGTAVYLIWQNPMMAVGGSTYIDQMLQKAGFANLIKKPRYPEVTRKEILELNPDFILLSSEPYPFREKHMGEYRKLFPQAKVKLVDGEFFSWYGSRLLKAPAYFNTLVY